MIDKHKQHEFKVQLCSWARARADLPVDHPMYAKLVDTYLDLFKVLKDCDDDVRNYFESDRAFYQYMHRNKEEIQQVLTENAEKYTNWPILDRLRTYYRGGAPREEGVAPTSDSDLYDDAPDLAPTELAIRYAEQQERTEQQREREDFVTRTCIALAHEAVKTTSIEGRVTLATNFASALLAGLAEL